MSYQKMFNFRGVIVTASWAFLIDTYSSLRSDRLRASAGSSGFHVAAIFEMI